MTLRPEMRNDIPVLGYASVREPKQIQLWHRQRELVLFTVFMLLMQFLPQQEYVPSLTHEALKRVSADITLRQERAWFDNELERRQHLRKNQTPPTGPPFQWVRSRRFAETTLNFALPAYWCGLALAIAFGMIRLLGVRSPTWFYLSATTAVIASAGMVVLLMVLFVWYVATLPVLAGTTLSLTLYAARTYWLLKIAGQSC